MKSNEIFREVFALAVRLLGLYLFYRGVRVFAENAGANTLLVMAIYFIAAYWVLRGPVVRWAYPEPVANPAAGNVTEPEKQAGA